MLHPGGPTTTTDATGSFLESAPAGNYVLIVSAPGYATTNQNMTIKAGSKTTAKVWMVPSASAGSVAGTVTDSATGLPVAGATVYINVPGIAVYTDANGNYGFSGLPAGNKTVNVSAPNYNSTSTSCTVTAGQTTTLNITLIHR
jgi:bacillopeptidase F